MEVLLQYKSVITILFFIAIFSLERFRPAAPNKADISRLIKNISFAPINFFTSFIIAVPIAYFACNTGDDLADKLNIPLFADSIYLIILDIIILDIFIYWWHRANHEIKFLWRFHQVHHLDENLDSTSALRFHFGEIILSSLVRAVVIIIFNIDFIAVLAFETIVFISAVFHHSNIKLPPKLENILSKIIVTPSIHWLHHHAIREDTDSNYCTIFSIWDRIFGSSSKNIRELNMKIGVSNASDESFKKLIIKPFKK